VTNGSEPAMTAENASSTPHAPAGDVDTVEHAAMTPEQDQPFAELGLKDDEYASIRDLLGRRPTTAELAMYSVMWSEHCSYKSSKRHLAQFGEKSTEEMNKHLLVGIGQNAGVVDVGHGLAVTFKVESHNSPTFLDPFQGAATGVGGIVRDIISMGARPVAVMDQIRAGDPHHPDTQRILTGAVAGIAHYAGTLGLPTIGGETEFDAAYQANPLVNAMAVGVMRHEDIHLANASGAGNKVVLFGSRTGGDGIGGASILSSATLDEEAPKPKIQIGDPALEKLIIECCMEAFADGLVEAIQDLGAAGISCATSELAANGDSGMHIDLENVLLREELTAAEILMSESQERMMAIVHPDKLEGFLQVCRTWEVEAAVVGEVNDSGRLTIDHHGQRIVDVDPKTVTDGAPVYDRPYARPAWQDDLANDRAEDLPRPQNPEEIAAHIRALVASPNLADKSWVTGRYDAGARGNTILASPDDAGVIRINDSGLGVALSADANGRFTKLDPYLGAQNSLVESYRNVACTGARPVAISDCLNFGSPEVPESMWQLVEAITGLADGCVELGIPVTGGNVSLYNSTKNDDLPPGHIDASIHPTPAIVTLGVIEDVARAIPSGWKEEGLAVYLLGVTREELSGSEWARTIHGHLGGRPPAVDFAAEKRLAEVLAAACADVLLDSAHDVSGGGLAQTLVECALRFGTGVRVTLDDVAGRDRVDTPTLLFSETGARAVVSVPRNFEDLFTRLCEARGQVAARIGTTQGTGDQARLEIQGVFDASLADLRDLSAGVLPGLFGPPQG